MSFEELLYKENILFHYTKTNIAIEKILPTNEFRTSILKNTDDPFEYKELLLSAYSWGDESDDTNQIVFETLEKLADIRKSKYRVISFTRNVYPSDQYYYQSKNLFYGCCKSRMWSQYGDKHKGIAFAFDNDKIKKALDDNREKYIHYYSNEVQYNDLNIDHLQINVQTLKKMGFKNYSNEFFLRYVNELFYYKNHDYRDEAEHRIIIHPKSEDMPDLNFKLSDFLIGLIIGDRFPEGLYPSLKFFADKYQVNCRKIFWFKGKPVIIDCNENENQIVFNEYDF